MSQFVLIQTHTPDLCPLSNEKARKAYGPDPGPTMALAQKLGIKLIAGPMASLDHQTFVVMDAPNAEAVREFVIQSGLVQWNSTQVIPVAGMEQMLKEMASTKPVH